MPILPSASRWQQAAAAAARQVLASRWRGVLECLELARAEQAQLRSRPVCEGAAARRAARRIVQLEHLRLALAGEMQMRASRSPTF